MSASATTSDPREPVGSWQLWIDGCGGYLLLDGTSWTVGGVCGSAADVKVQADWPRHAGRIETDGEDFFWRRDQGRALLQSGNRLPVPGSAELTFHRPSRLSGSAVLSVSPPHRFANHVDAVVLFRDTLLIGPGGDCHIRCRRAEQTLVLTKRSETWLVKSASSKDLQRLPGGVRSIFDQVAITMDAS